MTKVCNFSYSQNETARDDEQGEPDVYHIARLQLAPPITAARMGCCAWCKLLDHAFHNAFNLLHLPPPHVRHSLATDRLVVSLFTLGLTVGLSLYISEHLSLCLSHAVCLTVSVANYFLSSVWCCYRQRMDVAITHLCSWHSEDEVIVMPYSDQLILGWIAASEHIIQCTQPPGHPPARGCWARTPNSIKQIHCDLLWIIFQSFESFVGACGHDFLANHG